MNGASSNSDTSLNQNAAAGTPNSSSKFAQILLDLKREEKIDQSNNIYLNSHSSEVNPTTDKNNVTYNFAVEAENINYNSVSVNNYLSSFASSKRYGADDDEEQMAESDNENAYQDSSVMFSALNRLESTEMCNCKKSRCLKLYCQCFAAKFICTSSCRCVACENVSKNSKVRKAAVQTMLERNPAAFDSKYKPSVANQSDVVPVTAHKIGCKCRRSRCLKKYCECFEGAVPCSNICSCVDCSNPANQLGSGPEPSFAKVKTETLSQLEQMQTQSSSKAHKKLTFGLLSCSQETEASTDDEFEHPSQVEHNPGRSSTGKALNRSLSWSATASSSASHQLKRKRSVDSSSVFKKEYKERHSKKGLSSSHGPVPKNATTPSQQSNQNIHLNVPGQGVSESTPTGLNIVSALALLSSSIASEQKGLGWGNLTSLGLGQVVDSSNALYNLGIGPMSSTIASATPTSLGIASMLALLSQTIQAEQHQTAGNLDSPPAVAPKAGSSEAAFLSPNTLSIASALALLSSSIQAEQKNRQANGKDSATSSSSPAIETSSFIPEPLGESSTGVPVATTYHSSGGMAFLSPVTESARADCSSSSSGSSDRPSPSETTTDPENDSPSTVSNSFSDTGRAPLQEGTKCGTEETIPPPSDSISTTLPMMSPVF